MLQLQSRSMPRRQRSPLDAFTARWLKLIEIVFDPYRPERHYMRGPGPRWYAKHEFSNEVAGR
jgi:hypothetical protein